jgi:hypothetical protein
VLGFGVFFDSIFLNVSNEFAYSKVPRANVHIMRVALAMASNQKGALLFLLKNKTPIVSLYLHTPFEKN